MDQEFCLRWNNYKTNLTEIFVKFLQEEALVDVTIAVDCASLTAGLKFFKAHQTILSACSPYFEKIFLELKHPHPLIVLKDISVEEMEVLIHFMYYGEVNVKQEVLPAILSSANSLQIRGLADSRENAIPQVQPAVLPLVSNPVAPRVITPDRHIMTGSPDPRKRKRSSSSEHVPISVPTGCSSGGSERYSESLPGQCPLNYKPPPQTLLNSQMSTGLPLNSVNDIDTPLMSIKQEPPHHLQPEDDLDDNSRTLDDHNSLDGDSISHQTMTHLDVDREDPRIDHPDNIDGVMVHGGRSRSGGSRQHNMFREDAVIPGTFRCLLCNKNVKSRWHHEQTHFFRDHKCPYCNAVYSRLDTLKLHAKRIHHAPLVARLYPYNVPHALINVDDMPYDLSMRF